MRPYGSLSPDPVDPERGCPFAPPSREADLNSRHRRTTRRIYNHKTRRALAADLRRTVADTTL